MGTLFFNVIIDLIALLIVASVWLIGMRNSKRTQEGQRIFNALLLTITLIFLMDIPAWLLDGRTFNGAGVLLMVANTFYYTLQIIYCYLWLLFADYWSFRNLHKLHRRAIWYGIPMAIELLLIIANIKTGWVFILDSSNIYHRGQYYMANLIPYCIYILGAIAVAMKGIFSKEEPARPSLLIFMFLPICGTVLGSFNYGVSWLWPFVALSLLMVYLDSQRQIFAEERIAIAKREQDAKVAIMLSQIQPHFLYNSLTAISQLCDKDPKKAKKATIDFSYYLRTNLDSLTRHDTVPFETELRHIRTYLELEQMRFGEELHVIYDIEVTDFRIPCLTVQPLIENAVNHGVGQKKGGGTIALRTTESNEDIIITVSDDGVGFDPREKLTDGRTHIGISNIKGRLASQCGATLDIVSSEDAGTTATIKIPRKGD